MRVLLDENIPVDFAAQLQGHEVATVKGKGWEGVKNGELLRRASAAFDAFVTMDQNLPHQQNLGTHRLGFVLIIAPSNRLPHLTPLASTVLAALTSVRPGELVRVGA